MRMLASAPPEAPAGQAPPPPPAHDFLTAPPSEPEARGGPGLHLEQPGLFRPPGLALRAPGPSCPSGPALCYRGARRPGPFLPLRLCTLTTQDLRSLIPR